ncbi:MAG TPA: lytic transglycosylase domain-containing protein, partial [Phycisphaerales bacterium]|nr:lytic transglycosylase domain-containing protein [Phycisphaerales bacterium]
MAVANYLDGQTEIALALVSAGSRLPLDTDWVGVAGARYWHARWQAYPDAAAPTSLNEAGRDAAVVEWEQLVRDLPWSYYTILAYNRLLELAPERAHALARDDHSLDTSQPWLVRQALFDDAAFMAGVDLARLGLMEQAEAEWGRAAVAADSGSEMAWMVDLRTAGGDWHQGHVKARWWLKGRSPTSLGATRSAVLRVIYPDRFWDEVQVASEPYSFEPRFVHALVREESTFDAEVVSWAGAIGLAQLMPATARQVCGWLGVPYQKSELIKPEVNLKLGARYLESVLGMVSGSP